MGWPHYAINDRKRDLVWCAPDLTICDIFKARIQLIIQRVYVVWTKTTNFQNHYISISINSYIIQSFQRITQGPSLQRQLAHSMQSQKVGKQHNIQQHSFEDSPATASLPVSYPIPSWADSSGLLASGTVGCVVGAGVSICEFLLHRRNIKQTFIFGLRFEDV